MKCETIKEYLPIYFHNEIDKLTTREIKKHIKNCADCRKEFNYLKKTLKLVEEEEKIGLNFIEKRRLLNRISQSLGLQKERIFLQRKRAFAFGSGFAVALLLFFFLFSNIRISDTDMDWQSDYFIYGVEELNQQIIEKSKIASEETLRISSYNLDEKIEDIYQDMEKLVVLLDYNL